MQDPVDKLAQRIADIERQVRSMSASYQLGATAFSNGDTFPDLVLAANRAVESAAQAIKDSATALAKADGVVNTWYQESAPSGSTVGVGDFWVKTSTRAAYIRVSNGATPPVFSWVAVSDPDVAAALAAAQSAQAAADGKISTWFRPSAPVLNVDHQGVGDIWYDTDDQNKPYRWSGTAWQAIRDGKIQDALDAAADAQGTATTALNSANGRSRVVYSSNAPGSTQGTNNGDTWFRIDTSGTVLNQYRWVLPGATWQEVEPQSVTVASLDAGKITTGTLAAGVTITAGTPGSTRTTLSAGGIQSYIGSNLRFSVGGSTMTVIADIFRSANYINGGTSYVQIGDVGDGDSIDGIRLVRPNNSQVTLKNISNDTGGIFNVSFRTGGNVNQGGWNFSRGSIISTFSFWAIGSQGGGSAINGGSGAALSLSSQTAIMGTAGWTSWSGDSHTFNMYNYGSGLRIGAAGNGAYGNMLLQNTYTMAGLKFTADGALQARSANDNGYAYLRGILQDQSNPDLKENIVEINTDALAELAVVKRYVYDWKRPVTPPMAPVPRDSSTGLLLSEVPWSVQQTEDGYATGSFAALLAAGINQLRARVEELEAAATPT